MTIETEKSPEVRNSWRSRLFAEVKLHRALERAHGEYAQNLAAALGEDVIEAPALRGRVQRRIVALPDLATTVGMTAAQIAVELDHDEANTYTAINGLERAGMVEVVEDSSPRRWRLTLPHRRNRVLRLSRLIPAGKWTTYGQFAIAVYGNPRMGRTVGQVAKKNPAFANPHRLLKSEGVIDSDWRGEGGEGGPEECKRRLIEERAWDAKEDAADEDSFLDWEELKRLLDEAEEEDAGEPDG